MSKFYFLSEFVLTDKPDKAGLRAFSSVANPGKPFSYQGKPAIVDLAKVAFKETLPARQFILNSETKYHIIVSKLPTRQFIKR